VLEFVLEFVYIFRRSLLRSSACVAEELGVCRRGARRVSLRRKMEAAACVAGDEEVVFPATVDKELVSCTSGWMERSWLRRRLLGTRFRGAPWRTIPLNLN
jgi:hypothetical protein